MSNQLQQAITAIKAGDKQAGREILYTILKAEPYNENGWLWLSSTGDDDEAAKCLQRVLEINPKNTLAKKRLKKLQKAHATNGSGSILASSESQTPISAPKTPIQIDRNDDYLQSSYQTGNMAEFRLMTQHGVNYIEVIMTNDLIRTEAGAMRYYRGDISMETNGPGVGGFFKAKLTGESVFKPTYKGSGKLVLEPSVYDYFGLMLNDETYILDDGAYWASDGGIDVSARTNKLATGFMSGEGLVQTTVSGTGTVILSSPGPCEVLDLENDRLVVDGSFAVARSADLDFKVEKSTKSIVGSLTSGEGLVTVLEGTGRVLLAPIPNRNVILGDVVRSALMMGKQPQ
ncbi:MAG: AIM24 family protein [Chloroflexota bacterium]